MKAGAHRKRERAYSDISREAVRFLGLCIRLARHTNKMTAQAVAERAGISRTTLQKIERGDPTTGIGLAFEVAAIVGVPLFDPNPDVLRAHERGWKDQIALLPARVRSPSKVYDDF